MCQIQTQRRKYWIIRAREYRRYYFSRCKKSQQFSGLDPSYLYVFQHSLSCTRANTRHDRLHPEHECWSEKFNFLWRVARQFVERVVKNSDTDDGELGQDCNIFRNGDGAMHTHIYTSSRVECKSRVWRFLIDFSFPCRRVTTGIWATAERQCR